MRSVTELTRKEYWIRNAFLWLELLLVSSVLYAIVYLQGADSYAPSTLQLIIAIVALIAMALNGIVVYIALLVVILRRARNTGFTLLWFLVGAIVPFGFVVLGFVPERK